MGSIRSVFKQPLPIYYKSPTFIFAFRWWAIYPLSGAEANFIAAHHGHVIKPFVYNAGRFSMANFIGVDY